MDRKKHVLFFIIIVFIFSFSIYKGNVLAAFDVDSTSASYDSNTGWLIIYDDEFTDENSDYTQKFKTVYSKIKLGGILLYGNSYFNNGFVKIVLTNASREMVNENNDFIQTHLVSDQLILEDGAFVKTYTPSGGINVVVDSYSRKKFLDVNVKGLKPKMKVDSLTSSKTIVECGGGKVDFHVRGNNLDTASFTIKKISSKESYKLDVLASSASTSVNILENKSTKNRVDTFVLFINNVESDKRIDIIVQPFRNTENDSTNIENDITTPSGDNNISNNGNDTQNNINQSNQGNNIITNNDSNTQVDSGLSNKNGVISEGDNQSVSQHDNTNNMKEKLSIFEGKKESNNFVYIILGILFLATIVFSKKMYNKYKKH